MNNAKHEHKTISCDAPFKVLSVSVININYYNLYIHIYMFIHIYSII